MNRMRFPIRLVVLLLASTLLLPACNTIHGAGRDIEKAGESIQRSADRARD